MSFFDFIIHASLRHRWLVIGLALLLLAGGTHTAANMPVDVLPDLSAPTVTVITEAHGLAPEEVETLVTLPIEQALNGAADVRRLRSSSAVGISLVWVDFEWGVPPVTARQTVAERLLVAKSVLPDGADPLMAPMSSVMGEIMFLGLVGKGVDPGVVRDVAEWDVRRRLLAVPGIAQVVAIGGASRQVEVVIDTRRTLALGLGHMHVVDALRGALDATAGGFISAGAQEYLVRGIGRPETLEGLAAMAVGRRDGAPVLLRDVATVRLGHAQRRGDASVDGENAVVLKVQKQPHASTLDLTARIDLALDDIERSLPKGITLYRKGFRQADFITVAITNLTAVLRDGAILVVIVLLVFLLSWRTTLISLLALPLSLLAGILMLRYAGASINTMTLGGFAIAIGELVDDAVIDVENVYRRLRENAALEPDRRRPSFDVVLQASREIRTSVVYATMIILLVFAPLFFLGGIEGRLLMPVGLAYVTSIAASLVVALTVTPALCLLLLPRAAGHAIKEPPWIQALKAGYRRLLGVALRHPRFLAAGSVVAVVVAVLQALTFGRGFLPPFNEGALNIAAATAPGTSLETSVDLVSRLERYLIEHPNVSSVIRQTGRAEKDEHALDVNFSELEVGLSVTHGERDEVLAGIRTQAAAIPGLVVNVGQPISHRIEHLVSGTRASLVVKLFGEDLEVLRSLAKSTEAALKPISGLVDISVEQLTDIPQLLVRPRETELAAFGMSPGELARYAELALVGETVGTWRERSRAWPIVVRLPPEAAADVDAVSTLPIDVDGERHAQLGAVARVQRTLAPNLVNHENGQRRIIVTANVTGRDAHSAAEEVLKSLRQQVKLPAGYHVELGGEYAAEAAASRAIVLLSLLALLGMAIVLVLAFRDARDAALVMSNLPLALVGGIAAVAVTGGVLDVASLVGFITLFGIAARNGIMMVTHYRHLMDVERVARDEAVVRGSADRVVPILMTALTAALALVPLALARGEPGSELQAPMAAVILGGLLTSTVLNLFVMPSLFLRYGRHRPDADAAR